MKNYYLSDKWNMGDGWYLMGDGNPFMNDFQHNGCIVSGSKIFFPFSFNISDMYNVNLIF